MQHAQAHIAVVEDENGLREDLVEFMRRRHFRAQGFADAESLIQACLHQTFDLVILDIGLPGMDGLQALQWIREHRSAGVLLLTAMDSQGMHIMGLGKGADAYLVKNSSLEVIEATCRSVLRRLSTQTGTVAPGWRLNPKRWRLTLPGGEEVALTHSEAIFLHCLMQQPGTLVNRDALLAAINKPNTLSNLRNLDNCASRLRRKLLKQCGAELPVRSSYGNGYTFTGEASVENR